jgi:hypothetical protein
MGWLLQKHRVGAEATFSGGVIAGAFGHLVLAAWILCAFVVSDTPEEAGTSVMPALAEILLTPGVLLLALVRSLGKSSRAWAGGLTVGTIAGLLVVAVVTIAIDV